MEITYFLISNWHEVEQLVMHLSKYCELQETNHLIGAKRSFSTLRSVKTSSLVPLSDATLHLSFQISIQELHKAVPQSMW